MMCSISPVRDGPGADLVEVGRGVAALGEVDAGEQRVEAGDLVFPVVREPCPDAGSARAGGETVAEVEVMPGVPRTAAASRVVRPSARSRRQVRARGCDVAQGVGGSRRGQVSEFFCWKSCAASARSPLGRERAGLG